MTEYNPYQTPGAELLDANDPAAALAGRGQRFVAALVDGVISLVVMIPVMWWFGVFQYTERGQEPPFTLTLVMTVLGFAVFAAIHFTLLVKYGQTIGKKLLNIRIADMAGNKPAVGTLLFKRYLPVSIVGLIPLIGQLLPLLDVLFIFRQDRRCVHDLIAGTQVLRVTA